MNSLMLKKIIKEIILDVRNYFRLKEEINNNAVLNIK